MNKKVPLNQKKSAPQTTHQHKGSANVAKGKPQGSFLREAFRNLFSIDLRSLALFRIGIGALLLTDLAFRLTDLNAMYTDEGMFSRAEICRRATSIWNWSFHFASGSSTYQAFLFALAAVLALALLVGFETRLATIGSWLMLVSVHHRVPPILSGAEILLRMLLFWGMFLPLQRAWSLDVWLRRRRGDPADAGQASVFSVGTVAILLQMALMYLFSAIFKSNTVWFGGHALAGVLKHDFYASPLGAWLLPFPGLLSAMTWGTFVLEWLAPFLLFSPKATSKIRLVLIAMLAAMHIGIALCLEVGLFSHVALAGLALFLPAEFWNSRLLSRFFGRSEPAPSRDPGNQIASPAFSWSQGLCLFFLAYMLAANLNSLPSHPLAALAPEKWKPLSRGCGLSQSWGMFDSVPSKDGWYIAKATLRDGSEVDLLREGAAVDWIKPAFPARLYPNHFWQKLFREMAYDDEQGFQLLRSPVAKFLCRRWNGQKPPDKQIVSFELIYCMQNKGDRLIASTAQIFREPLLYLDLSGP